MSLADTWIDGSTYSAAGDVPITPATSEVSRTGTGVQQIVVEDNTAVNDADKRFLRIEVRKN